jgi:hypothetical protein
VCWSACAGSFYTCESTKRHDVNFNLIKKGNDLRCAPRAVTIVSSFFSVFAVSVHTSLSLLDTSRVCERAEEMRACMLPGLGVFKYVLTFAAKNATRSLSLGLDRIKMRAAENIEHDDAGTMFVLHNNFYTIHLNCIF